MTKSSKQSSLLTLVSDGGSQSGKGAAAAALVDLPGSSRRCVAVFLGQATNNEAEIFGALIGFSLLSQLVRSAAREKVNWLCDSEYVLKSATSYIWNWQRNGWRTASKEPVKNQGLWRAYLELAASFEILPEHVRGHSGHPENELCDLACNELIVKAEELFDYGDQASLEIDGEVWTVFDCRTELQSLRGDQPVASAVEALKLRIGATQGEEVQRKLVGAALLAKLSEALHLAEEYKLEHPLHAELQKLRAAIERSLSSA